MSTSDVFGALSTFQCLAISVLATKRICVITTLNSGGKVSIPVFKIARLRLGCVITPVMLEIERKMEFQKLVKCLQAQNIWRRFPIAPQFLQHIGELFCPNLEIL